MNPSWVLPLLRCPVTGSELRVQDAADGGWRAPSLTGAQPVGPTPQVLRAGAHAFPVVDGIPVLMAPERLTAAGTPDDRPAAIDVTAAPYAECYAEQRLYAALSEAAPGEPRWVERVRAAAAADRSRFPEPAAVWQEGGSTVAARTVALRHLTPLEGCTVLQLGGHGGHAVTMLIAGAARALVVSPVVEELRRARRLAQAVGVADRLGVVCGIAEALPLADGAVDRVFSGASMHHTVTTASFPETARVLAPGGRFASVDVWRSGRVYDLGIRLFGKRHGNEHCRPLDHARVAPAADSFASVEVTWHGAVARYPLAVVERIGRSPGAAMSLRLGRWEDRASARLHLGSRLASLVVVRATR